MKLRRPRQSRPGRIAHYRPGDILVFSGRGGMSSLIQAGTCSCYTHVAVCSTITAESILAANTRRELAGRPSLSPDWLEWQDRLLLLESTTLCAEPCLLQGVPVSGVQAHEITARVCAYDGDVWVLRLREPLSRVESQKLTAVLLDTIGTRYDHRGALLSATIWLKHGIRAARAADRETIYCCESTVDALQKALSASRKYKRREPGSLAPRGVVRWARPLYWPMAQVRWRTR